jgi:mycothiol synthase
VSTTSPADHAVAGTAVTVRVERAAELLELTLLGSPAALDDGSGATVSALEQALISLGATEDGTGTRLVADHPPDRIHPLPTAVAERLGLHEVRDLFQMRRPLPVPPDDPGRAGAPPLGLRPFDPSKDVDAWVRANNRAFATHPDQGRQTPETLAATLAEPWIDLDGFLVSDDADRPGELTGFCWTRVHPARGDDPALGEIYVIGVDPSHHGQRLGRTLVLAGLDHLEWSGITTGMLYVEADNEPALRLYDRLGFTIHLRHRICSR